MVVVVTVDMIVIMIIIFMVTSRETRNAVRILNKMSSREQQTKLAKRLAVPGEASEAYPDARLVGPL